MGYRIKEKRIAMGLTQDKLAADAGITRAIISRLENGQQTDIKASTLKRIAIALRCSISDLIDE